jgi:hypothetical protein
MRSPLRMVANGVSDTIATLSVWLSLPVCTENLIRVDAVMESRKLTE